MLDDREICICGHSRRDHDHLLLECYACDCVVFKDQNDLDMVTPPVSAEGVVEAGPRVTTDRKDKS